MDCLKVASYPFLNELSISSVKFSVRINSLEETLSLDELSLVVVESLHPNKVVKDNNVKTNKCLPFVIETSKNILFFI